MPHFLCPLVVMSRPKTAQIILNAQLTAKAPRKKGHHEKQNHVRDLKEKVSNGAKHWTYAS
jgi:hypothetical protein